MYRLRFNNPEEDQSLGRKEERKSCAIRLQQLFFVYPRVIYNFGTGSV